MKIFTPRPPYWGLCLLMSFPVYASEADFARCAKQYAQLDAERLKCYDQASLPRAVAPNAPNAANAATLPVADEEADRPVSRSYFTRLWNLDNHNSRDESKLGRLRPHRQNYLIMRKSTNTNTQPNTPTPGHATLLPIDMDAVEAKFLISLKTDIGNQSDIDVLGFKTFRLWGAYTQQSHWQILNTRNSSPFRETNYEPELIGTFGTGNANGLKLVNIGLVHQSNGRSLPQSRSWNRAYLQGGWEFNNSTSIMARGWWRIPENPLRDDNPDMINYMGQGDLLVRWEPTNKSQSMSLLMRNNFRLNNNKGFVQLDWSTPISFGNAARMYVQLSSGYGESMVDYNQQQTTLGFGFSFREW